MRVPLVLFLASVLFTVIAATLPGLADLALLAGLCSVASLWLLAAESLRRERARAAPTWIIVDGSNVMHWKDGIPQIATLRLVLDRLVALGFSPGVVFDANAGYLVAGRYLHHAALGRLLALPEDRVMVVHKGTPADATILAAARDLGSRIVSNDQFRDWADSHPDLRKPGMVVRGGFRDGALWLTLDEAERTPVRGMPVPVARNGHPAPL
jgi:hypothetical protein